MSEKLPFVPSSEMNGRYSIADLKILYLTGTLQKKCQLSSGNLKSRKKVNSELYLRNGRNNLTLYVIYHMLLQ